ncbi:MAG: hypothetical protein JST04_03875 [Bdellovibrionales bacterium]|nr:hypothetical protein [Bdellovibrionales bacterium]
MKSKFISDLEQLHRDALSPIEFRDLYLKQGAPSGNEIPEELFHEFCHFVDDADIRAKDVSYGKMQKRELLKLIGHLKRGADKDYLKSFTFSKASEFEASEIDEIRKQLDLLADMIPESDQKVMLVQDGGGPDESSIRGTKLAFFRFGLKIMMVPFAELFDHTREPYVRAEVASAIDDRSDIGFDGFLVSDALPGGLKERNLPTPSYWERTKSFIPVLIFIWLMICCLVGCGQIFSSIFRK